MNIPESAIRPFEPLGIPKIDIVSYRSIRKALDVAFHSMNHFGEMRTLPVSTNTIEGYLRDRLEAAGANPKYTCVNKWYRGNVCHVSIHYAMECADLYRGYSGIVRSKAGFDNS